MRFTSDLRAVFDAKGVPPQQWKLHLRLSHSASITCYGKKREAESLGMWMEQIFTSLVRPLDAAFRDFAENPNSEKPEQMMSILQATTYLLLRDLNPLVGSALNISIRDCNTWPSGLLWSVAPDDDDGLFFEFTPSPAASAGFTMMDAARGDMLTKMAMWHFTTYASAFDLLLAKRDASDEWKHTYSGILARNVRALVTKLEGRVRIT